MKASATPPNHELGLFCPCSSVKEIFLLSSELPQPEILSTREGYDRWAEIYDDDGNPLVSLEEPWIDRLVGPVEGMRVLDVGCGTGRHALRLAEAGAIVDALDFSSVMLQKARVKWECLAARRTLPARVAFHRHDLLHPLPFDNAVFARVVCGLVLDHIANLDGLFTEMARVCQRDGLVIVSVMHPALMLRGVQARFWDPTTGRETRPASCPNQISDYVMAAARAGLTFVHASEHPVDESLAQQRERARKYLGWPLLFLMALKPGG